MRLGIIGYGKRMAGVLKAFRQVEPDTRVVGVLDPDEAGVRPRLGPSDQEAVFYPDMASLVRHGKPDALAIGTRCHQHTPYAIEAADYGLPLFLEKPVSINMEQAIALEERYEKCPVPVVVSFPLRVSPLFMKARELVHRPGAAKPQHVLGVNYVPYGTIYWEQGYRNFAITRGLFLQKATHDLDALAHLMGDPIVKIAATGTFGRVFGGDRPAGLTCGQCGDVEKCMESPRNRKANGSGGTIEDHPCLFSVDCGSVAEGTNEDCSSAVFELASGAHGVYTQVFFSRRDAARRGATVSSYTGTVDFDWYRHEVREVLHHEPFTHHVKAAEGSHHFGGDAALARNFVDVVRGRGPSCATVQAGLQSVYACLAAVESMRTGRFVNVRQVGQH